MTNTSQTNKDLLSSTLSWSQKMQNFRASFLKPVTVFMEKLTYWGRLLFVSSMLMAPVTLLLWLQISAITANIDFTNKEKIGLEYIEGSRQFLFSVQKIALQDLGQTSFSLHWERSAAVQEAQSKWSNLQSIDNRLGVQLKTTARLQEIAKLWETSQQATFKTTQELQDALLGVCDGVIDLILNYAGNNSNLILDPDLDSYWLMDMLVIKLPFLSENITSITFEAVKDFLLHKDGPIKDKALESEAFMKNMSFYATGLGALSDATNVDMKTIFKETKWSELQPHLQDPFQNMSSIITNYYNQVKQVLVDLDHPNKEFKQLAQEYLQDGLKNLMEVHYFFHMSVPDLDHLLSTRLSGFEYQRRMGLFASAVLVFLMTYLFTAFYESISRSINSLGSDAAAMIAGKPASFHLAPRDDLWVVANEIEVAVVNTQKMQQRLEAEQVQLQSSVDQLIAVVSQAAQGDLRVRANTQGGSLGELAQAFNDMQEGIQHLVREIHQQVVTSKHAVDQITGLVDKVAYDSNAQADQIVQITQMTSKMSDEIRSISENARNASSSSQITEQSAVEGTGAVSKVVTGMERLYEDVQSGAHKVKSLGDRIMQIIGIVGQVTYISDQINVLALNATIEAVRAGEQGRGFAVVADEVRKLAKATASAAEEINRQVDTIHAEANDSVKAIGHQTQSVEEEVKIVSAAGSSLERIKHAAESSAALISSISQLAYTQADATEQLSSAMSDISQLASSTKQGAENTVNSIMALQKATDALTRGIDRFQVS